MKHVELTGIDKKFSRGILGTMNFGDTVDENLAAQMIDASLEAGVTVIDTANSYSFGGCEEMLGRLLVGKHDSVILATKVGIPHPDAQGAAPLSAKAIETCVGASLKRLGVEKVDLYYLHAPDRATNPRETLETFKKLHDAGKFDAWGFSNYSAWQALELIHISDEIGLPRPVLSQQLYNPVSRRIEQEYLEFSKSYGLHLMVYNPLAGGLLSGKHRFDADPTEGRFGNSKLAEMYKKRYWNQEMFAAIEGLSAIAKKLNVSLPELAFRWLNSKPQVDSILLGASKYEQLVQNLVALELEPLSDADLEACDAIGATLAGPMVNYNR